MSSMEEYANLMSTTHYLLPKTMCPDFYGCYGEYNFEINVPIKEIDHFYLPTMVVPITMTVPIIIDTVSIELRAREYVHSIGTTGWSNDRNRPLPPYEWHQHQCCPCNMKGEHDLIVVQKLLESRIDQKYVNKHKDVIYLPTFYSVYTILCKQSNTTHIVTRVDILNTQTVKTRYHLFYNSMDISWGHHLTFKNVISSINDYNIFVKMKSEWWLKLYRLFVGKRFDDEMPIDIFSNFKNIITNYKR